LTFSDVINYNKQKLGKGKLSEKTGRKVTDLSLRVGDKVAEPPGNTKKSSPAILPIVSAVIPDVTILKR